MKRLSVVKVGGSFRPSLSTLHAQTKEGFQDLIKKIEFGVAQLEGSQSSIAKRHQTEVDLAVFFDSARRWLDQLMQSRDKSVLTSIFEGDSIEMLADVERLCYRVELSASKDHRRLDLLERIRSANQVVADLGYAEKLREAKLHEGETQDSPVAEVIPHLTDAAFRGNQAMAYEQVSEYLAAAETYDEATKSLRSAIMVCQAVVKLKASIGAPESLIDQDFEQLKRLERQTSLRSEHLKTLEPGATPIPFKEQVEPVDLSIHHNFKLTRKMMQAYAGAGGAAAVGVGGIVYMCGPFGFALLAGATLAAAMAISFSAHDAGEQSGHEGLKQALANIAELADGIGKRVVAEVGKVVEGADGIGKRVVAEVGKVVEALSHHGKQNMA